MTQPNNCSTCRNWQKPTFEVHGKCTVRKESDYIKGGASTPLPCLGSFTCSKHQPVTQ